MNNIAEQKILTAEAKGGYTASSDSEKDWQKITIIDATSSSLSDDGDDNDDNETDDDDDDHKIEEKMITPEGKAFKDEVLKQEEFLLPITIYISATQIALLENHIFHSFIHSVIKDLKACFCDRNATLGRQ